MITLLYGGSQSGKFLDGLLRVIPQEELTIIVNTINNVEVCGLEIYPTLEYLLFLLAGRLDTRYWKTIKNDTYSFMNAFTYLFEKEAVWYRFGDTMFAHALYRRYLMELGKSFTEAVEEIAKRMGIRARVYPMTDEKVRFVVSTDQGELPFLEYRVKEAAGQIKEVKKVEFVGIEKAKPTSKVKDALSNTDAILIGPSNPPLYIEPMLALHEIKSAIEKASCNVIAISPVLGDEPLDRPIQRLMKEALGQGTSILDIVERYPGLIDTLIIDETDKQYKEKLEEMGMEVIVTTVRLSTHDYRTKLAELVSKLLVVSNKL